jgi:hypothetical protein
LIGQLERMCGMPAKKDQPPPDLRYFKQQQQQK